jgi:hypothetical protein
MKLILCVRFFTNEAENPCRKTLQQGLMPITAFNLYYFRMQQLSSVNPTAAAAPDFFIGTIANGGTANRKEPQSILLLSILIEAQSLC